MQSPFCESLLNFNVTQAGIELRHGDSTYKKLGGAAITGSTAQFMAAYGQTKAFAVAYNNDSTLYDFYDIDAGTISASTVSGGPAIGGWQTLYFNNYLFFFTPLTAAYALGRTYNGAWAGVGYTGSGLAPYGGNVYKGRAYIVQYGEPAYWYTDIGQVTGAITKVDLVNVVTEKCKLSSIAKFTLADTVTSVAIQAFIFDNGEVIFYSGSYPDSSNWGEIGRAHIGQAVSYNGVIPYQGDALVLCDSGVVSMRDLFLKGSEQALNLSVNSRIQATWTTLVQAIRTQTSTPVGPIDGAGTNITGVFDGKNERIVISFPYQLVDGTIAAGSTYFIFNASLQSWYLHRSVGFSADATAEVNDMIFYKNKVLGLTQDNVGPPNNIQVFEKEGSTGYSDKKPNDANTIGYPFEMKSAPVTNGRAYVQQCQGLDVILNSDLFQETTYNLIGELGFKTTVDQKLSGVLTGSIQKPNVNIGIEASYIQYKISGTTTGDKTVGLKVYGVNFWQQNGTSPR